MKHHLPPQPQGVRLWTDEFVPLRARDIVALFEDLNRQGVPVRDYLASSVHVDVNTAAILIWLATKVFPRTASLETIRTYSFNICDVLNDCRARFDALSSDAITAYLRRQRSKGISAATVTNRLATLKSMQAYWHNEGWLRRNPAANIPAPKERKRPGHHTKVLELEEMRQIMTWTEDNNVSSRDVLLLKTLWYTGIRAAEGVRLTWGDIERRGSAERAYSLLVIRGKGAKEREVYVPDPLMEALMDYRFDAFRAAPYSPAPGLAAFPVFGSRRRRAGEIISPITSKHVWRIVKHIVHSALGDNLQGRRIGPHSFRHTNLTMLRQHGASLEDVSRHAGHSDITTTQIYDESPYLTPRHPGRVLNEIDLNTKP